MEKVCSYFFKQFPYMAVKKKTSLSFQIPRASYTENLSKQKPNLPGQLLSFTPS